jgi:hypothetical protein
MFKEIELTRLFEKNQRQSRLINDALAYAQELMAEEEISLPQEISGPSEDIVRQLATLIYMPPRFSLQEERGRVLVGEDYDLLLRDRVQAGYLDRINVSVATKNRGADPLAGPKAKIKINVNLAEVEVIGGKNKLIIEVAKSWLGVFALIEAVSTDPDGCCLRQRVVFERKLGRFGGKWELIDKQSLKYENTRS